MCIILCIMSSIRFNITLPEDVGVKLKASKNRSRLVSQSLREKFEREEKTKLEKELEKAYAKSAKEDKETAKDWDSTSSDGIK